METSIFLSYANPYLEKQQLFVDKLFVYLKERGFSPRTLGVTDYDTNAPLKAIRRLMLESNGLLTIAFRRAYVEKGMNKPSSDLNHSPTDLSNTWLTSPYCHIEPAMAFQLGLPILIFREKGVIQDGLLEKGVLGIYMPEIDLNSPIDQYFESREFKELLYQWEGYVRSVVDKKGNPPKLY